MEFAKEFLKFVAKEVTLRPRGEVIDHRSWNKCAVGLFTIHLRPAGTLCDLWSVTDELERQIPRVMEDLDSATDNGMYDTWEELRLGIENEIFLIEMSQIAEENNANSTRSV
jgi:hypothetical protein